MPICPKCHYQWKGRPRHQKKESERERCYICYEHDKISKCYCGELYCEFHIATDKHRHKENIEFKNRIIKEMVKT